MEIKAWGGHGHLASPDASPAPHPCHRALPVPHRQLAQHLAAPQHGGGGLESPPLGGFGASFVIYFFIIRDGNHLKPLPVHDLNV